MRVGLVSHWYDPEPGAAAAPGTVARLLRSRGHDVQVLTGYPHYPTGRIQAGYRVRPYQRENQQGVTVHRAPVYPSHDMHPVKRAANYLSFASSGAVLAPLVLSDVDVVLVYSTPATAALPAMSLKALRGIPFALWVQDLWPDSVTSSDLMGSSDRDRIEGILHRFCDRTYREAGAVAAIAPGMVERIASRGIPRSSLHLIPNWADEASFLPTLATEDTRHSLGPLRRFSVMYAGNFGGMQGLETVIEAANLLRDRDDIGFVLVGGGVQEQRLRNDVRRNGLTNVTFVESQPFERMSQVLSLGDVQLVTLKDVPILRSTIPSKLQANLAAGRPVIGAVAGDPAEVIRESGAGRAVPPEDPQALARAIVAMASLDEASRRGMGEAGRRYYQEHFSQAVVGDLLDAMLAEVADGGRHG